MVTIITRKKSDGDYALYALAKSLKALTKGRDGEIGKVNTKISLGMTMNDEKWNEAKSALSSFETAKKKGRKISFIGEQSISNLWEIKCALDAMMESGWFDVKEAKKKIHQILHKEEIEIIEQRKKEKKISFNEFVENSIKDMKTGKKCHPKFGTPLAENTIQLREEWFNFFRRYQKDRRIELDFDDIDYDFISDFKFFMLNQKRKDGTIKPMKQNGISAYLSILCTFLSDAYDCGVSDNTNYRDKKFKVARVDVDNVALSKKQVDELLSLDFSDNDLLASLYKQNVSNGECDKYYGLRWINRKKLCQSYERTRDIFVVGCLTGQRLSDYIRIEKDMYRKIGDYQFIVLKQKKTGQKVFIPLDKRVDEILTKYKGRLPAKDKTEIDRRIKIIGELLGWTYTVEINESSGLKTKRVTKRFCDCISSHSARRTWATIAYQQGVPLKNIMSVTGHKTEQMLRKYLKLNEEETGIETAKELSAFMNI